MSLRFLTSSLRPSLSSRLPISLSSSLISRSFSSSFRFISPVRSFSSSVFQLRSRSSSSDRRSLYVLLTLGSGALFFAFYRHFLEVDPDHPAIALAIHHLEDSYLFPQLYSVERDRLTLEAGEILSQSINTRKGESLHWFQLFVVTDGKQRYGPYHVRVSVKERRDDSQSSSSSSSSGSPLLLGLTDLAISNPASGRTYVFDPELKFFSRSGQFLASESNWDLARTKLDSALGDLRVWAFVILMATLGGLLMHRMRKEAAPRSQLLQSIEAIIRDHPAVRTALNQSPYRIEALPNTNSVQNFIEAEWRVQSAGAEKATGKIKIQAIQMPNTNAATSLYGALKTPAAAPFKITHSAFYPSWTKSSIPIAIKIEEKTKITEKEKEKPKH